MTASRQILRFFHAGNPAKYLQYHNIKSFHLAHQILHSGYVLMIARLAFDSKEDILNGFQRRPGQSDAEWQKFVHVWCHEARHLYLACIDPDNLKYITSSAGPNPKYKPTRFDYCAENMPMRHADLQVCQNAEIWEKYHASAILLPKKEYPLVSMISAINKFKAMPNNPKYSSDPNMGYDCQTSTRDILSFVNPDIDPRNLALPDGTRVLAYHSSQSLSPKSQVDLPVTDDTHRFRLA